MTTTAIAPTNIAVLKYWGRVREEYNIPTKSSLSFTVKDLYSTTTVRAVKGKGKLDFTLNRGKKGPRTKEYGYVRGFMERLGSAFPFVRKYDYKVMSENNFPTAAGFASSASGFAALVKALVKEVDGFKGLADDDRKLSALARLGSGSAARSIPSQGGFVKWDRGSGEDWEKDPVFSSYALALFGPKHWPEFRILYVKVEEKEKKVMSRVGMAASVRTNPLYQEWVNHEEGLMKNEMVLAVGDKDFGRLAPMIMQASNNFHAICLGTYPPIHYLREKSIDVINSIHEMNQGRIKAAYTFDAGPNPVVFALKKDEKEVAGILEDIAGKDNVIRTSMGPGPGYSEKHLF